LFSDEFAPSDPPDQIPAPWFGNVGDVYNSLLGPLNLSLAQLNVGFLVLQSTVSLNVTAVYTATDLQSASISIDVQSISERQV
jgi:hypothetical protein